MTEEALRTLMMQACLDAFGIEFDEGQVDELMSAIAPLPVLAWIASHPEEAKGLAIGSMVAMPVKPTEAMIEAGWIDKEDVDPDNIYCAMIAAASPPEAPSGEAQGEG